MYNYINGFIILFQEKIAIDLGALNDFMKITSIICEYNPFHNGHAYHMDMAKKETNPDALICVMSGNFTQRGDIALLDKYTRAKHAILGGADVVIELPAFYAVNCAEKFAYGACKTLSVLDDVTLSFGSECGNLTKLVSATNKILSETADENTIIKQNLENGQPYVRSLSQALDTDTANLISKPNNTLAIEYLKASKTFNLKCHTIKRLGDYNDIVLQPDSFASATAIRKLLMQNESIDGLAPSFVASDLYGFLPSNTDMYSMLAYSIITSSTGQLEGLLDVSEGLENRIKTAVATSIDYETLIQGIKTKRYTMAKIKRILLYSLFELSKKQAKAFYNLPPYVKILAVKRGREDVLKYISERCPNTVLKYSDIKTQPENIRSALEFENKIDDIYHIVSKNSAIKTTNCLFV